MAEIIQIQLSISNTYLVKGRRSILVDTGSPNEADKILAAVTHAGVDIKDLSLILHSHGHIDHAGSSAELKRRLGIPTAIHKADAFMLRTGGNGIVKPRNLEARLVKALVVKSYEGFEPDIVLEEDMTLTDFGVDGKVILTPGHTAGSLSIIFENSEAIIGDVMMGGYLGGSIFGALPNYHYFADDLNQIRSSIKTIIDLKPLKLYVGHGGPLAPQAVVERFSKDISF